MNRQQHMTQPNQLSPIERVTKAIADSPTVAACLMTNDNADRVRTARRLGVSIQRLEWFIDNGRAVLSASELAVLAKILRCESTDLLLKPTHQLINRYLKAAL